MHILKSINKNKVNIFRLIKATHWTLANFPDYHWDSLPLELYCVASYSSSYSFDPGMDGSAGRATHKKLIAS